MLAKPVDIFVDRSLQPNNALLELWASNLYSRINNILRNYPIDVQYKQTPRLFFFVQQFIKCFYTNGVYAKDIRLRGSHLYRGFSHFKPATKFNDPGFMSTSWDKNVACGFATSTGCGTILTFRVSKLPKDVPFLIIDDTINKIFQESEVVMLPGILEVDSRASQHNEVRTTYTCDSDLVAQYTTRPIPSIGRMKGGDLKLNYSYMNTKGKNYIFYRAIIGRDAEVLTVLKAPVNEKEFMHFLRYDLRKTIHFYDSATQIIPEVCELQKMLHTETNDNKISKIVSKLSSYNVNIALYNPKTKTIDTMNAMVPDDMHEELFPTLRSDDVRKAIHLYFQ
jgi:hypothetical protein